MFQPCAGTPLLIGEGAVADQAVGEDVEIDIADATEVTVEAIHPASGKHWEDHSLIVRNATARAVHFEAERESVSSRIRKTSVLPVRRDGTLHLPVTVPANGSITLRYHQIDAD